MNALFQATESEMDMTFRDAIVDFKNLGMVGSLLQGVLATAAPVLFEAIKPGVLSQVGDSIFVVLIIGILAKYLFNFNWNRTFFQRVVVHCNLKGSNGPSYC